MEKRKTLYGGMVSIAVIFILYTLANNFIIDPGAKDFLSHKTGLGRELNLPVWLKIMYVHIAFACAAMAAGLINFSNRIFEKGRKFHRMTGYAYVMSVLVVVLTSGYMAPYATGGKASSMGFNALNIIWLLVTIMALVQIKKKRIIPHRQWMIRSYAFCFTNMTIHLLTYMFDHVFGIAHAASYIIGVYGSVVLLLVIPDRIIRSSAKQPIVFNAKKTGPGQRP